MACPLSTLLKSFIAFPPTSSNSFAWHLRPPVIWPQIFFPSLFLFFLSSNSIQTQISCPPQTNPIPFDSTTVCTWTFSNALSWVQVQLTLNKQRFELHGSTCMWIFFKSELLATPQSATGWIHGCGGSPSINYTQINPHISRRSTEIHLAQVRCHSCLILLLLSSRLTFWLQLCCDIITFREASGAPWLTAQPWRQRTGFEPSPAACWNCLPSLSHTSMFVYFETQGSPRLWMLNKLNYERCLAQSLACGW